jgi:hypothetical protein
LLRKNKLPGNTVSGYKIQWMESDEMVVENCVSKKELLIWPMKKNEQRKHR